MKVTVFLCALLLSLSGAAQAQNVGESCLVGQEGASACNKNGCYICKSSVWTQQALLVGAASAVCASEQAGLIQFTDGAFKGCDGTEWVNLSGGGGFSKGSDSFSFTDQSDVGLAETVTSNTVVLAGTFVNLTAVCGENCTAIARNGVWGGATIAGFMPGDTVAIRQTSPNAAQATQSASVTVGTTSSAPWTIRTGDDACFGSPSIGTVCADGTLYAGLSPDGNVPMYTTVCDLGQSGSKGSCSGTRAALKWGTYTVSTGYTNVNTGQSNTANLVANYGNYKDSDGTVGVPAAQACADLVSGGKSDWYLPAKAELHVLSVNRAALGNTFLSGAYYWPSTEYASNYTWIEKASDGTQTNAAKYVLYSVRCVRKKSL